MRLTQRDFEASEHALRYFIAWTCVSNRVLKSGTNESLKQKHYKGLRFLFFFKKYVKF